MPSWSGEPGQLPDDAQLERLLAKKRARMGCGGALMITAGALVFLVLVPLVLYLEALGRAMGPGSGASETHWGELIEILVIPISLAVFSVWYGLKLKRK